MRNTRADLAKKGQTDGKTTPNADAEAGAEQTIAEPDAPEDPALMPDPEQVITTETMLPNGGHKTHRKCMTTGGGTGRPRTIEHKPELH
jgi:hypothetical protein